MSKHPETVVIEIVCSSSV